MLHQVYVRVFSIAVLVLSVGMQPASAEDQNALRGTVEARAEVPQSREQIRFSFAPLVKRIAPAVVNVYAARQIRQRASPFAGDPFFERFFGPNPFSSRRRQRTARSLGSGVIVAENGTVITNHHVIKGADEVKVALSGGKEFPAQIILIDEKSDLAVLKIEDDAPFPAVPLADSDALEVGDLVLAIGNPFGVGQTVTSGIVSALARSRTGVNDFGFFIQTDASINPGNSGGALVDMDGRLVGINTAIFSKSGGSNGIGFAVPSNMVRVVKQSVDQGGTSLLRPWIGADFQMVTSDIADSLGMKKPGGALVAGLYPNGPADKAGLQVGDVVLAINQRPVEHVDALGYRLTTAGIGGQTTFRILRRAKQYELKISLMEAPEDPPRDERIIVGRTPFTGATVANLSPRVAMEIGMRTSQQGVVITKIDRRSPAARFGFKLKDLIVSVNDERLRDTRHLQQIVAAGGGGWQYEIERNGKRYQQYIR